MYPILCSEYTLNFTKIKPIYVFENMLIKNLIASCKEGEMKPELITNVLKSY